MDPDARTVRCLRCDETFLWPIVTEDAERPDNAARRRFGIRALDVAWRESTSGDRTTIITTARGQSMWSLFPLWALVGAAWGMTIAMGTGSPAALAAGVVVALAGMATRTQSNFSPSSADGRSCAGVSEPFDATDTSTSSVSSSLAGKPPDSSSRASVQHSLALVKTRPVATDAHARRYRNGRYRTCPSHSPSRLESTSITRPSIASLSASVAAISKTPGIGAPRASRS